MQILIPMAGEGSRFKAAGYTFPKPLIEVLGTTMIHRVVESLGFKNHLEASYIYLVRKEHVEQYHLREFLNKITPGCIIEVVDKLTEGAACTTLLAKNWINNDVPLLIANSDQFIEWNNRTLDTGHDGCILTFGAIHPKWSYAKLEKKYINGVPPYMEVVTEVAEKNPISTNATVGVYYWKRGSDYVKYAEQMISKNIRTNNEFYVCPVFNEAINDGKIITAVQVNKMWGLGTPEDLQYFERHYEGKI